MLTPKDVIHVKPHPKIHIKAVRRLGVSPSEMMVLKNSNTGCRSAIDADAFVMAVPTRQSQSHDFRDIKFIADYFFDRRIYDAQRT